MPYPKNFAVRLIICVVGFLVIFNGIYYLMDTFVRHQAFNFRPIWNVAIPAFCGVLQAMNWKDPAEKAREQEPEAKQDETQEPEDQQAEEQQPEDQQAKEQEPEDKRDEKSDDSGQDTE